MINLLLSPFNSFATSDSCANVGGTFFGFPHWWQYMKLTPSPLGGCDPVFHGLGDLLPIGIAVLQMLLYAAGFIAVIMVIVGGLEYIFAGGEPEKGAEARKRIVNSLIGLVIAVTATAIVSFLGNAIK